MAVNMMYTLIGIYIIYTYNIYIDIYNYILYDIYIIIYYIIYGLSCVALKE